MLKKTGLLAKVFIFHFELLEAGLRSKRSNAEMQEASILMISLPLSPSLPPSLM
jgi:hypothetical protein